jgi:hypothetical protein
MGTPITISIAILTGLGMAWNAAMAEVLGVIPKLSMSSAAKKPTTTNAMTISAKMLTTLLTGRPIVASKNAIRAWLASPAPSLNFREFAIVRDQGEGNAPAGQPSAAALEASVSLSYSLPAAGWRSSLRF